MPREHSREMEEERKAKTAYDLMRIKLNRLQRNVDRPAPIPAKKEPPKPRAPPEFVRNVVGSSAAAGSAEFHIFRNNRRRELDRLDHIEKNAAEEELDKQYADKVQARREAEEAATAKRRLKRQRKKEHKKNAKKMRKTDEGASDADEDDDDGNEREKDAGGEESATTAEKNLRPEAGDSRESGANSD